MTGCGTPLGRSAEESKQVSFQTDTSWAWFGQFGPEMTIA